MAYRFTESEVRRLTKLYLRRVRKDAMAVIELKPDGRVALHRNERGRLSVIAIVGPADHRQHGHFREVLLAEIGFWKGRPYNRSSGSNGVTGSEIQNRQKWFSLTEEQYQILAPFIFLTIQNLVESRVAGWKTHDVTHFRKRITVYHWSKKHRCVMPKEKIIRIPRGIRITFDARDKVFLPDLYWAELHSDTVLSYLREFANWIRGRVWRYEKKPPRRRLQNLKGGEQIAKLFRSSFLPLHLKVEALQFLPRGEHYLFYDEIAEILGWDKEELLQTKLARENKGAKKRIGQVDMRIEKRSKGLVLCTFYPRNGNGVSDSHEGDPGFNLDLLDDDDCPF